MPNLNEPLLGDDEKERSVPSKSDANLKERIKRLVTEESYGVLCTQSQGQPYGSMIAFAFTEDLSTALFATSRFTRKYQILTQCKKVAIVVNNREKFPSDLNKIEAITVTGSSEEIQRASTDFRLVNLLVQKHPHLKSFITSPSTAVFRVNVVRYFHVHRFQEVREWVPGISQD
jgi:nitroimidazol reductase NimA-like FMN-containing flavoprotein (pyridoxamine 5'-phosphate oxidase superfamily)